MTLYNYQYKAMNKFFTVANQTYTEGLNEIPLEFDPVTKEPLNGLHALTWEHFDSVIDNCDIVKEYIWDVEVPSNAITVELGVVLLCDKFILSNKRLLIKDKKICLRIIEANPWFIQWINKPTPQMCALAVKCNGFTLRFIKKQTEDMCLDAVSQFGCTLRHVHKQTEKICVAALKQTPKAFEFVKEPFRSKFISMIIGSYDSSCT